MDSIRNPQLRSQVNNYFSHELSLILEQKERRRREALARARRKKSIRHLRPLQPSERDRSIAKWKAIHQFPQILDYYLALKEERGDEAVEQDELARNLKAAEEKYLLYVNKREEARIADALDQGGILNVTIAEQPRVPALRARSEWGFGLLGILLAGPMSLGLVFAADYLDPAFRTPEEVVAYLETPVLASLPSKNA